MSQLGGGVPKSVNLRRRTWVVVSPKLRWPLSARAPFNVIGRVAACVCYLY